MSSKILRNVIQRGPELDDIAASVGKNKRNRKCPPKKNEDNNSEEVEKSVIKSQV